VGVNYKQIQDIQTGDGEEGDMMDYGYLNNVLNHVLYEIYMYLYTLDKLKLIDKDDMELHNVLVEDNLLHLRILIDYFTDNDKKFKLSDDDICISFIVNNPSEYYFNIDQTFYNQRKINDDRWISKTIQHLTKGRTDKEMFEKRFKVCIKYQKCIIDNIKKIIEEIPVSLKKRDDFDQNSSKYIAKIENLIPKINLIDVMPMTDRLLFTTSAITVLPPTCSESEVKYEI
jgi:hypothetical protein